MTFFFLSLYIYLYFLAMAVLRCCAWAFSSCGGGMGVLLSVAVCGLLIAVASRLVGHGLQLCKLQ